MESNVNVHTKTCHAYVMKCYFKAEMKLKMTFNMLFNVKAQWQFHTVRENSVHYRLFFPPKNPARYCDRCECFPAGCKLNHFHFMFLQHWGHFTVWQMTVTSVSLFLAQLLILYICITMVKASLTVRLDCDLPAGEGWRRLTFCHLNVLCYGGLQHVSQQ